MSEHTPTPWAVMPSEEWHNLNSGNAPSSVFHIGDYTVVTETPSYEFHVEDSADAAFIAEAANNYERVLEALKLQEQAEEAHLACPQCDGEEIPELCGTCFPLYDDARQARRLILNDLIAPRHT